METSKNKEIVRDMYETILNQKQLDKLNLFVDEDYEREFNSANKRLFTAFPDIKFTIKEIFQDNNKVVTLFSWSGTHKDEYFNIAATQRKVTVEGMGIYELKNGKITHNIANPDKLSFFQQLGIIPQDFISINSNPQESIYLVDEFEIPKESYHKFKEKMDYNRSFIHNLEGFVKDDVIIKEDTADQINIMTIAVWKNKQSLEEAKHSVQSEYKRIGFNPKEFYEKLNLNMKRGIYSLLE
jgi:predicted ester cyclase